MTNRNVLPRAAMGLLTIAAITSACGKTGPLRPPEPRGPLPAGAVEARQIGDRVEIALTVPDPRGQEPSQQVARTEILRVGYPRGVTPQADPDAFRVRGEIVAAVDADYARPGARLVIADPSLKDLADAGIGWTLRYGVRVRDLRGRPSPLVVAKDITTVPPAAPPRSLAGQASADGVRLSWEAPAGTPEATYNVYRGAAGGLLAERPLNINPLASRDYLDASAESAKAYRYVVRAVAAEGTPFRESPSSDPVIVDASDRFPPASPTGLVAVQEGRAVRLLWNPGGERDLDGYVVYRDVGGAGWGRLSAGVVRQPSYLDAAVKPGELVRYRVTAVDRAAPPNEGAPSSEVEVRVAADPASPAGGP